VNLGLPLLIALATAGMTTGAVLDYYLGRAGIHELLEHRVTGRLGRKLAAQLRNAQPLLRRHGWWMMLFAHAFGHGRSSLAIAAGASGFPLRRFLAIEVPAAALWSSLYAGGGYLLARDWRDIELLIRRVGWAGAALVVAGALGWYFWHRQHASPDHADHADHADRAPAPATPASTALPALTTLPASPTLPATPGAAGAAGTLESATPPGTALAPATVAIVVDGHERRLSSAAGRLEDQAGGAAEPAPPGRPAAAPADYV
jgi:membrane protein DedA with SNARE-associated domain